MTSKQYSSPLHPRAIIQYRAFPKDTDVISSISNPPESSDSNVKPSPTSSHPSKMEDSTMNWIKSNHPQRYPKHSSSSRVPSLERLMVRWLMQGSPLTVSDLLLLNAQVEAWGIFHQVSHSIQSDVYLELRDMLPRLHSLLQLDQSNSKTLGEQ